MFDRERTLVSVERLDPLTYAADLTLLEGGLEMSSRRDPRVIKAMDPAELVETYRGLVGSIVNKLRRSLAIRISIDDLESYGFKGLLEAHQRFDPEAGTYFASFAYYRIRGAILDGCRKEGWLTRERKRDANREQALDEYMETEGQTNQNSPTPSTFRDAVDRVAQMADAAATVFLLSEENFDTLETHEPGQYRRMEARTNINLVRAALEVLTDEEQEVIKRHHFGGEKMDQIAETFGHSRSWVSRVNTRALEKMRDHIVQIE
jgi:RNA polymerase sigma factor for flagellar operon FliA